MAMIINASVDLRKIDKSRIKQHKNGGLYYDITIVVNDDFDNYGNNVSITERQTKEEKGNKKVFLGNGKIAWVGEPASKKETTAEPPAQNKIESEDDLPF